MGYITKRKVRIDSVTRRVHLNDNAVYNRHTYKVPNVYMSNSWSSDKCVIICGGESVGNIDLVKLTGCKIVTVNRGFETCPHADIVYCMDMPLYDGIHNGTLTKHVGYDIRAKWLAFEGKKVFIAPKNGFELRNGDIVYLVRRLKHKHVSTSIGLGIYPGGNSAFGAMMLAIALGCRTIYFIGLELRADTQTHYHNGYPGQQLQRFREKLVKYQIEFEEFADKIKQAGVTVYNTSKTSVLSCFEYRDVKEVLG